MKIVTNISTFCNVNKTLRVKTWACFLETGYLEIDFLEGRQNFAEYCQTIETFSVLFVNDVKGTSFVYRQDNVPIYKGNEKKL